MAKVIACIIARTTSQRLPLKVLRDAGYGYSILELLIRRLKTLSILDDIFICTSLEPIDDIMEDVARINDVKLYRGSADVVIERMIEVGKITDADILLRITGDNPLTSIEYIADQVHLLMDKSLDYVRLIDVPLGATAEVIKKTALEHCYKHMDPAVSEYLMLFIYNPKIYKCGVIKPFKDNYSNYSMTVDTPADLERLKQNLAYFPHYSHNPENLTLKDVISFYKENENLSAVKLDTNSNIKIPYGKVISNEEFQQDMKDRENRSIRVELF